MATQRKSSVRKCKPKLGKGWHRLREKRPVPGCFVLCARIVALLNGPPYWEWYVASDNGKSAGHFSPYYSPDYWMLLPDPYLLPCWIRQRKAIMDGIEL